MKRILILCTTVAIAAAVACQTEMSDKNHLDRIASDSVFHGYRASVHMNTLHIIQGLYDIKAIGEVIKTAQWESICDYPELALVEIRGGLLYRDSHCNRNRAAEKLNEKFPGYWALNDTDKKYINLKYKQIRGGIDDQELINTFESEHHDD